MSKQTNAFQQLIHYVHEKVEVADSIVTESATIYEQNIDEKISREIDILIEKTINGNNVRVAIECRDRNSKDDIQWVDSLIGKYLNLEVQKVIAVSNSGFSKSAQLKAAANGIELKTLEEALNVDFENEFVKLGMATISCNFNLERIDFEFSPAFKYELIPQLKVFKDNEQILTLDELVVVCVEEGTNKKITPYMNQNFLSIFKTRFDLNKLVMIEHKIPINGLFVQSIEGQFFELLSLTIKMLGKTTVDQFEVKHRAYESALVTEGTAHTAKYDKEYTIYAVQNSEATEGKVFLKSKKIKPKST